MIKTVGLIGAGSVGSGLISQMYAADCENVYVLAKGERAERFRQKGISVNNDVIYPNVYSDKDQNIDLDVLIVASKTYSLEQTAEDFADLINQDTIIIPIQNGIMATEKLRRRFPENRVLYGIVVRTDAHRMGRRVYFNTLGEMQIGYADNREMKPEVQQVYDRLRALGVNVTVCEDMRRAQWLKWMLNIGGSQVAAETHVECGFFGQVEEIRRIMELCMEEVVEIAKAEGVNVTQQDCDEIIDFLIDYPPDKKMSMLQDLEAGRPIEIDEYAGTVIQLGKKHGIPTPANEMLNLTINARRKVDAMRKHVTWN
ncbi:MAG: 2-dehydropantoate 2-reductase [Bacillota bacterium]|nr:2-dehydropantoate 2-reductase [Bacillota bacterium]